MLASKSASGTMSIASHGHPARKAPSAPLLVHNLQPMQSRGSTEILPNGGWSVSGIQSIHSFTAQYPTHAGEPEQPVLCQSLEFDQPLRQDASAVFAAEHCPAPSYLQRNRGLTAWFEFSLAIQKK